MQPDLRAKILGKEDLRADKLDAKFDPAFVGWSMYQPHHYLPSPVYDLELILEIDSELTLEQLYADHVRNKKKSFAPVFISRDRAITKEMVVN